MLPPGECHSVTATAAVRTYIPTRYVIKAHYKKADAVAYVTVWRCWSSSSSATSTDSCSYLCNVLRRRLCRELSDLGAAHTMVTAMRVIERIAPMYVLDQPVTCELSWSLRMGYSLDELLIQGVFYGKRHRCSRESTGAASAST